MANLARMLLALLLIGIGSRLYAVPAGSVPATDVSVRLFSTQTIHTLHIMPDRATMKLCAACAGKALSEQAVISAVANGNGLLIDGKRSRSVWFDGSIKMTADGGRAATGAGHWRVSAGVDGLHAVLTLPSERYVMAVLQSEAAPDEPVESLKALAVVARSFALVNPHRHGDEGLCDSTHCQAMRVDRVSARVGGAVRDTAGETLWFGGKRVEGYFTQNCGGVTADGAEVWGGQRKPWLVSHRDPFCQRVPSQWRATVDEGQLREALAAEGWRVGESLKAIRVVEKDSSGRAKMLEIASGGNSLRVSASTLRFAVNRALGWSTLRSDWYVMRMDGKRIVFEGKGFGHGVGLCQAGAAEMARQGKNYREIAANYFPQNTVRLNANDNGWRSVHKHVWTLRSSALPGADTELIAAGNAAFAEARRRSGGEVRCRPVVTVAPDTELFRQMTGQPGWALATTSGTDVVMQPLSVVRANGSLEMLLTHEFLHVFVEAEAGASAPLWLREGLVEMLAGEAGTASTMSPDQIDAALRHASSLKEAQTAHRAACGLVRKQVAEHGEATVRMWLQTGVR